MPLFRRKPRAVQLTATEMPTGGLQRVVGESHYQDALIKTSAELVVVGHPPAQVDVSLEDAADKRWFRALLIPEPDNPHDPHAIGVHSQLGQIGYLPRDDAAAFEEVFAEMRRQGTALGTCPAFLVGGTEDSPTFGAVLTLSDSRHCLEQLLEP